MSESVSGESRSYPNPGYLGSSSHTTLFHHLTDNNQHHVSTGSHEEPNDHPNTPICALTDDQIEQGAAFINQIRRSVQLPAWKSLVEAWTDKGINLPVAEPFTMLCADVACSTINQCDNEVSENPEGPRPATGWSEQLFLRSCEPLKLCAVDTIDNFRELFCGTYARWETLGIFFTAVSRATIDISHVDGLYSSEQERRAVRKLAMRFSDICLDIALSLDCLNDLQLILQYENFILHSLAEGDQSKR